SDESLYTTFTNPFTSAGDENNFVGVSHNEWHRLQSVNVVQLITNKHRLKSVLLALSTSRYFRNFPGVCFKLTKVVEPDQILFQLFQSRLRLLEIAESTENLTVDLFLQPVTMIVTFTDRRGRSEPINLRGR